MIVYLSIPGINKFNATNIAHLSEYINIYIENEEDQSYIDIDVLCDINDINEIPNAIKSLEKLEKIAILLHKINKPDKKTSLKTLHNINDDLKLLVSEWKILTHNNSVYEWLFPNQNMSSSLNSYLNYQDVASYFIEANITENNQDQFYKVCTNGNIMVAKWLYSLGYVNIHIGDDYAFRLACGNGHEHIVKWLYSIGNVNIHAEMDQPFRLACGKGYESIAKWLYSIGNINIHRNNNQAIRWAIMGKHNNIVKWLMALE